MRKIKAIILLEFAFLLIFCSGAAASDVLSLLEQPTVEGYSIRPGEALEYSAKLRKIPAGTQILEVDGKKTLNGHEVYHVKSESRVTRFFNIIHPFSNRYESFILSESLYPMRSMKQIRDGGYRGKFNVDFDQDSQIARITRNGKKLNIRVPPGTQDELSMIYLFRSREMKVGKSYQFSLLTGARIEKATLVVLRTEQIKTILGTLDTIVVKTIPKDITIWLTNDSARIPVKIEVPTKAGKLVSKLKSVH